VTAHEPHPEAVPIDEVGREERALPGPSTIELIVTALGGTVPEVRDALLAAADSLLDAARAVVEAADRVLCPDRDDAPAPDVPASDVPAPDAPADGAVP
jgi:hypothetical protein